MIWCYVTIRVVIHHGYIVAYRRLVTTSTNQPREEKTPIYCRYSQHDSDLAIRPFSVVVHVSSGTSTTDDQPEAPLVGNESVFNRVSEAHSTPSSDTTPTFHHGILKGGLASNSHITCQTCTVLIRPTYLSTRQLREGVHTP
jgi:hypothetical protein